MFKFKKNIISTNRQSNFTDRTKYELNLDRNETYTDMHLDILNNDGKFSCSFEESINVLNLIEGTCALIESPTKSFEPFEVHFAETFIIPAAVGSNTISPSGDAIGTKCATIKAYIR